MIKMRFALLMYFVHGDYHTKYVKAELAVGDRMTPVCNIQYILSSPTNDVRL